MDIRFPKDLGHAEQVRYRFEGAEMDDPEAIADEAARHADESYGQQDWDDDNYEDDYDDWNDPWEEALMNCGMDRSGLCGKAGSEECDWECPLSGAL